MVAMLGGFVFEICDVSKVEHTIKPHWGKYRPIYSDPIYHNTHGREKHIKLSGKRIAKSNKELSYLESIASSKKVTRLTLQTGESASVIITDCKIARSNWIDGGGAIDAEFSISMIQTKGGVDIFGIIAGVIGALV